MKSEEEEQDKEEKSRSRARGLLFQDTTHWAPQGGAFQLVLPEGLLSKQGGGSELWESLPLIVQEPCPGKKKCLAA